MAYMNQVNKVKIRTLLVGAIPHDWKWSLSVHNHSTLVLNISSAPTDLISEYTARCSEEVRSAAMCNHVCDVNPYHWREHFDGELLDIFSAIFSAMNYGNHDRSDPQTDYFDVGHYVAVTFGHYEHPFVVSGLRIAA
jgi:hypothetical protein